MISRFDRYDLVERYHEVYNSALERVEGLKRIFNQTALTNLSRTYERELMHPYAILAVSKGRGDSGFFFEDLRGLSEPKDAMPLAFAISDANKQSMSTQIYYVVFDTRNGTVMDSSTTHDPTWPFNY